MYTTPPSTPQKQQLPPLKINKQITRVQLSPKPSRRRLLIDAEATAPEFLKNLLMNTTANRKLLQEIKEGVAKVIKEATEHSSILDMKITACDEVVEDIKKMMSFPPPPPASPAPQGPEPAEGAPE
jgi:hypothetical protein